MEADSVNNQASSVEQDQAPSGGLASQENLAILDHTTVVIPYVKNKAQGNELKMALRSFDKFLRFGVNVVIIGDREEWMSDVVTVIEHECVSDNPQIDVLEKLKLAIAADEVTDKFIWSNDDIYLVAPVMLAHIEVPKNKGILRPELYKGIYRDNMERTVALLADFPKLDFGTHTPVVYEKQKSYQVRQPWQLPLSISIERKVPHIPSERVLHLHYQSDADTNTQTPNEVYLFHSPASAPGLPVQRPRY